MEVSHGIFDYFSLPAVPHLTNEKTEALLKLVASSRKTGTRTWVSSLPSEQLVLLYTWHLLRAGFSIMDAH